MTSNKTTSYDDILDDMRSKLRAEYEASPELRAEFVCGADYAAYFLNTATATPLIRQWRADFDAAAAERAIMAVEARSNVQKADARRAAGRFRLAH